MSNKIPEIVRVNGLVQQINFCRFPSESHNITFHYMCVIGTEGFQGKGLPNCKMLNRCTVESSGLNYEESVFGLLSLHFVYSFIKIFMFGVFLLLKLCCC